MDSGNSGSMQSSSGGDEEYADSRTEPLSSFFTPSSSTASAAAAAAALPNLQQPPPPPPPFFDSLSYLDAFHLDAAAFSRPFLPSSSMRAPLDHPNPNPTLTAPAAAPRSSKKRSRASRRAPTTVLTTDTSNFRAMVQEFTGIPSPPFSSSSSSSFPRSRFDFFHPSSSTATPSSALPNPPPPFLLKPFPQKFQTHPSFNPISSSPPITATTAAAAAAAAATSTSNANTITNSAPTNYNYQNPILNFQSLLQSPLTNMPAFITKPQPPRATAADYGVTDLGVPGLIGSGWADGLGPEATSDHAHSRQVVGNYGSSKVSSSCKLNYSGPGSTSDFHAEKGSEGRGEGMVESWICSSD